MKKGKTYVGLLAGTLIVSSIVHGSKQSSSMPGLGGGNMLAVSRPVFEVPGEVSEGALILADALLRDGKDNLARRILEQVGISYEEGFLPYFNPETKPFDNKVINAAKMCFIKYFWEKEPYLCEEIRNHIKNFEYKYLTNLGCNDLFVVARYLNSIHDVKNLTFVCYKNRALFDKFRKNPCPLTKENQKLFPNIETQVIYTPFDYIKPKMWRYIIAYPVTAKEINDYVKKLKPNPVDMRLTEKPIVFDCKIIDLFNDATAVAEESDDVEIKKLLIKQSVLSEIVNRAYDNLKHLGKPIILEYFYGDRNLIRREVKENSKCLFVKNYFLDTFADYAHWKNYAKITVRNVKKKHSLQIIEFLKKQRIPCQGYVYHATINTLCIDIQKDNEGEFWLKAFNEEEIKAFKDSLLDENEKKIDRFPFLHLPEVDVDMGPDIFGSVSVDAKTPEELKYQLNVLLKDKNVREVMVPDHFSIPLEYVACPKIRGVFKDYNNDETDLFLSSKDIFLDNVICKDVYCIGGFCFAYGKRFNVENLYICKNSFSSQGMAEKGDWKINGAMRIYRSSRYGFPEQIERIMKPYEAQEISRIKQEIEKFKKYVKYLNLEYLVGFVNIANKPEELTDAEWYQVKDLKEKADRIKTLMRGENLRKSSKK